MNGTELVETLRKCTPSEIHTALLEHPDVIAVKLWTKEDVENRAMLYVADNTDLDEKNALKKIGEIVGYVLANPHLLKDELSDCTGFEWDAIDNAVSIAAQEIKL